jgi:citrate synthase
MASADTGGQIVLIDEYDLDRNELIVRGQPLLGLIDSLTYPQLLFLGMTGHIPSDDALSMLIREAIRQGASLVAELTPSAMSNGDNCAAVSAICGSLLKIAEGHAVRHVQNPAKDHCDDDQWYGFVLLQSIRSLIGRMNGGCGWEPDDVDTKDVGCNEYSRRSLTAFIPSRGQSHLEATFCPDRLMGSLIGGFGIAAPTTALARFSASTRAPVEWCIVASAMGSGPAHLGACSAAMYRLKESGLGVKPGDDVLRDYCYTKPYPGFGHPIMNVDPRSEYLFDRYIHLPLVQKACELSEMITQTTSLSANVDFAAAAVLLAYGVPAELGSLFFWFCRLPIIIAHISAKRLEPPFGLRSSQAREKYRNLPKSWI